MSDDPFLGVWRLDPDQSAYKLGQAPQSGTYTISATDEGYRFTINWTSVDGKTYEASYEAIPDGHEYPSGNPAIADTIRMTRVDRLVLDSAAHKDGERVAYARRTLSTDLDTMIIEQVAIDAEGERFVNTSVYHREEPT